MFLTVVIHLHLMYIHSRDNLRCHFPHTSTSMILMKLRQFWLQLHVVTYVVGCPRLRIWNTSWMMVTQFFERHHHNDNDHHPMMLQWTIMHIRSITSMTSKWALSKSYFSTVWSKEWFEPNLILWFSYNIYSICFVLYFVPKDKRFTYMTCYFCLQYYEYVYQMYFNCRNSFNIQLHCSLVGLCT